MAGSSHGYSGTPLHKKLGLKPGMRYLLLRPPEHYEALLEGADGVRIMRRAARADIVHLFCRTRRDLDQRIAKALERVDDDGALWISWPKKSSPMFKDLTENQLREVVLPTGWVDVKVCAIDSDWSALRFVRRKKTR